MPSEDTPPFGKQHFVYWQINSNAEVQSDWLTKNEAIKLFQETVRRYLTALQVQEDDGNRVEVGIYDAGLEATTTIYKHTLSGTV